MTGADSIVRLRAIATRLSEREDQDSAWFANALAEYEAGALHGLTLGDAFGFRLQPGESSWWELEARSQRDALIRRIVQRYFGGLSARSAADALAKKVLRYESGDWRSDRKFKLRPTLTGLHAELFQLLKIGVPVSVATIRRALAHEIPLLVSHEAGDHAAATKEERHGTNDDEAESNPGSGGNSAGAVHG